MGMKDVFNDFLNKGEKQRVDTIPTSEIEKMEKEERHILDKLDHERKSRFGFGKLLKNPIEVLMEKPTNILILSIPIALLIFIIGFSVIIATSEEGFGVLFTSTLVDDLIVICVLVALTPMAILHFKESSRVRSLEESLPNFFRDVAGMNDSGMTLPNAVHIVAGGEYGTLTPHVKKLDAEMSWNIPFVEAIIRFGTRLGTPLALRSVDLIAKASRAGGDASEVLRAAATDTYEFFNLKTERRNNMLIYMIIVIVSFLVFLFVIAILVGTFLTTMAQAGAEVSKAGAAASQFMGAVDIFLYKRIFSHAAMIQGFFSGLVAGQMGEGDVMAGIKYSVIMLAIAWLTFRFFI